MRSIPAPAGEPRGSLVRPLVNRVYPRACGGTAVNAPLVRLTEGLSPRLRGNHVLVEEEQVSVGSIPAPAGEPWNPRTDCSLPAVYPRACGGTPPDGHPVGVPKGLSPRLRGNRGVGLFNGAGVGSIPAPAGEPRSHTRMGYPQGVYPRACGGTCALVTVIAFLKGLSPRLRGNRR